MQIFLEFVILGTIYRRGQVDHSTIYRWGQKYAPEIDKRMRWQWRRPMSDSWRVDETYIKVRGKWTYLYRAVDKLGNTIDFYLSSTRNAEAATRSKGLEHRQVKYLNKVIEAEHGKLKQLVKPVRGFKTMKTAYATIKGFEVMRALRKGQGRAFNLTRDRVGEKRMIERVFGVRPCAMTEAVARIEAHLAA